MYSWLRNGMSRLTLLFGVGLLTVTLPGIAMTQNPPNQQDQSSDTAFMKEAADGGMAEVELGELATAKASSSDVRAFGERMVTDHKKANDQLKTIAANKGVTLPIETSAKNKATKNRLSKLSGDAFDKAYMADMVRDHKKDVASFEKESNTGKDPELKQFAAETLPTLQDHLKQAESLSPKSTIASSNANPTQR